MAGTHRKLNKLKHEVKDDVKEKASIVKQSICSLDVLKTLLLIIFFFTFSISLTFYNRKFIHAYRLPLSITMTHLVSKFIMAGIVRKIWSLCTGKPRVMLEWREYVLRVAPPGIASSLDIGLSNWGLEYITVSLYTMTKSTVIVFILLFSLVFKLERMRVSLLVIVICIAIGVFLFNFESTQFHLFGFCLVLGASFLSGLRWTLAQMVLQKNEIGLSHPVDMMFHIQPWMMVAMLPLSAGFEGTLLATTENFFRAEKASLLAENLAILALGAFLAFFLELSEFLLVSTTSSLTLSVSGIVKEIVTLLLAALINGDRMTWLNGLGLAICFVGITLHVILKAIHGKEDSHEVRYHRLQQEGIEMLSNNGNAVSASDDEEDVFNIAHDWKRKS